MDIIIDVEFLSGLIGKPAGEITEALKKEGTQEIKSKEEVQEFVKEQIAAKLNATQKSGYDKGHKIGMKKGLNDLEKDLATEWDVEYTDGMTVKEIASAWQEKQAKAVGSSKITPESVKAHEVYINDLKTEITKRTTLEKEYADFKSGIDRKSTLGVVAENAKEFLKKHSFGLPEDEAIQKTQFNSFLEQLTKELQFEVDPDAKAIKGIKNSEGKPVLNSLMNEVTFEEHTVATAKSWFPIVKADERKSPGITTQPQNPLPGSGGIPVVKNSEEYFRQYDSLQTLAEKQAFATANAKVLSQPTT